MKKITLTFALVAMTTLSAWAFTFPEELGTAEYGKVADVPKELKEATSLYDKADIAGFTIVLLLLLGIGWTTICEDFSNTKDLWAIITPIITLALGYLFGEKSKKE